MKNIIVFIISLFVLCGCSSSKKLFETSKSSQSQSNINEKSNSDFFTRIDTTKSSDYEFTYTKIEFYNPAGNGKEYKSKKSAEPEEELEVDEVEPIPVSSKKPPNGGIKSIEQWTGKLKTEEKGETEASASLKHEKEESVTTDEEASEKAEETPKSSGKHWKYIFYLCLLAIGVFIYIKRTPIFKAVKNLFK